MRPRVEIYRYGAGCRGDGLWIGVTRFPPRGVRASAWRRRGYFELRLPLLSPSRALLAAYLAGKMPWAEFSRRYRREMAAPAPRQAIALLARAARQVPVHLGCFCADPARCHRSVLAALLSKEA